MWSSSEEDSYGYDSFENDDDDDTELLTRNEDNDGKEKEVFSSTSPSCSTFVSLPQLSSTGTTTTTTTTTTSAWTHVDYRKELQIEQRIGGGGLGIVYQGWWYQQQKQKVAIKTLFDPNIHPSLYSEFMDELLIMNQLSSHPNIVQLLGASTKVPHLCLVMELCQCSLSDVLYQQHHHLTQRDKIGFCLDIAKGIQYLHCHSIIHRDIKSFNILLGMDGSTMKLCDFGLCKVKSVTAGTPNYQAPEILESTSNNNNNNNNIITTAIDIYALTLVMWEIFSRSNIPFLGLTVEEIKDYVCVRNDRPPIPYLNTPSECRDLISSGWQRESSKRPNIFTFVEVLHSLKQKFNSTNNSIVEDSYNNHTILSNKNDALDDLLRDFS